MAIIDDTITYYVDLLLYQYINAPKARATISLLVGQALVDLLPTTFETKFDIETAEGDQLDCLGEYIGFSRQPKTKADRAYFIFADQLSLPSNYYGLTDYLLPLLNIGVEFYLNYPIKDLDFTDLEYSILLKLKLIINNSDSSLYYVNNKLFELFPNDVVIIDQSNMAIIYVVTESFKKYIDLAYIENILPKPIGVGIVDIYPETTWTNFFELREYVFLENNYEINNLPGIWGVGQSLTTMTEMIGQTFVALSNFIYSFSILFVQYEYIDHLAYLGARIYEVGLDGFPTGEFLAQSVNMYDIQTYADVGVGVIATFNFDTSYLSGKVFEIGSTYAMVLYTTVSRYDDIGFLTFPGDSISLPFGATYTSGKAFKGDTITNVWNSDPSGWEGYSMTYDLNFDIKFLDINKLYFSDYLTGTGNSILLNSLEDY